MKPFQVTSVGPVSGSTTRIISAMSYEEAIRVAYQTMSPTDYVNGSFKSLTVTAL